MTTMLLRGLRPRTPSSIGSELARSRCHRVGVDFVEGAR
jgi:hypothetical protein